ncbi:MAG: BACON domain-containing carbohydrate-binding protein [Alloprevotella sp.]|nr:BACON domain-containing carbohydrate-binding protein [Alloprevotella sp.]
MTHIYYYIQKALSICDMRGCRCGMTLAALLIGAMLPATAQTQDSDEPVQDAMYVYRNDGKFHGFYKSEIVRMEFSKIDTLGQQHVDYVVQEIETLDSLYRIPVSAIDSVSFITPRTEYADGMKATTTSELWDYVVASDSMTCITLSPSTPASLMPVVGDKLCTTKSRNLLPGGFYGTVQNVTTTAAGTRVECRNEGFTHYLKRHMFKGGARVNESAESAARRRALAHRIGHDSESAYLNIQIDTIKKEWDWSGEHEFNDNWKVSGEAKAGFAIAPEFFVTAFGSFDLESGLNMDCAMRVKANMQFDVNAKATIEGTFDESFKGTILWIPDTPFFITTGPGFLTTFTGELEMNYHYEDDIAVEVQAQVNQSAYTDNIMLNANTRKLGHEEKLEVTGTATVAAGPYYKVSFILGTEDIGKIEARIDAGGKTSMQITVSSDNFYEHTDTIDTSLYDALNQDGSLKIGAYAKAKITAKLLKWEKEWPAWEYEPGWTMDGGVVPKFSEPTIRSYNADQRTLSVGTSLSRSVLIFTAGPVGFELFDDDGKPLGKRVWTEKEYIATDWFGDSYNLTFTNVEPEKWYIVHPLCHFGKRELVAGPSKRFYAGLQDLTVDKDSLKFDYGGGTDFIGVRNTVSKETSMNVQYDDWQNNGWLTVEATKDGYNITCQPNTGTKRRTAKIEMVARDPNDTFGFNSRRRYVVVKQEVDPAYLGLLFQQIGNGNTFSPFSSGDDHDIWVHGDPHPEVEDFTELFGRALIIGSDDIDDAFSRNPVIKKNDDGTFTLQGEGLTITGQFDPVEPGQPYRSGAGKFRLNTDMDHHRKTAAEVEAVLRYNGMPNSAFGLTRSVDVFEELVNLALDEHYKRDIEGDVTVTWNESKQQYQFQFVGTGTLTYGATCYTHLSGIRADGEFNWYKCYPNATVTGTEYHTYTSDSDMDYTVFYELNE